MAHDAQAASLHRESSTCPGSAHHEALTRDHAFTTECPIMLYFESVFYIAQAASLHRESSTCPAGARHSAVDGSVAWPQPEQPRASGRRGGGAVR
jgi:hypothetical protein